MHVPKNVKLAGTTLLILGITPLHAEQEKKQQEIGGWDLSWSDEFNDTKLNDKIWTRVKRGKPDWRNMMSEQADLLEVKDGRLLLKGIVNPKAKEKDQSAYLTAGVTSKGKYDFKYGKVQIRARFQSAKGAWPALWMMKSHAKWGKPGMGEIDLMEHLNFQDKVYQTIHSHYTVNIKDPKAPKKSGTAKIVRDQWNTYGAQWNSQKSSSL